MPTNESLLAKWEVERAWVSNYSRSSYGDLELYHPEPASSDGLGARRVSMKGVQNGTDLHFKLQIDTQPDSGDWHSTTKLLLESAIFYPLIDGKVLLSPEINLLDSYVSSPFPPFTHVTFSITQKVSSGKRTFTTNVLWTQKNQSVDNPTNLLAKATGYPWKDHS